jgi:signal transduction histidine kinase
MTRAGWTLLALAGLAAAVFIGGEFVPAYHQALEPYLSNLPIVPGYLISAFLYLRRPNHPVARRLLVLAASPMIALGLGEVLSVLWLASGPKPWYWAPGVANQVAELAGVAAGVALVAIFPDGRYQRLYERWIVYAATGQVVALPALLLLCSRTVDYDSFMVWAKPTIYSPVYVPALGWLETLAVGYYDSIFLWALVAAVVLALRYRRLPNELRLQVKWPLWAALCFAATIVIGICFRLGLVPYWFSQAAWYVTLPLFPLCIAIAMLRYRLLDIDVVVRKSLVYGVLWLAILGAYLGLAWALGLAARDRLPIELAILLTIAATIAFQPARHRLEVLADRLVFGERLSGYHALQQLGTSLETTVDPEVLGPRLASTIRSALGLRWVRVSSPRASGDALQLQPIACDGIAPSATAVAEAIVPLENAGDLVGVIECGPKSEGGFDRRDQDLLRTLARQAALALRNARLASDLSDQLELVKRQAQDLSESRARIVQAQDAERRRIQRDLHDGVQQHLVTLAAKLRRATRMHGTQLNEVLHRLAGDAEETVFALQDFSNGIYPSVLSDEGVPAALWTHAQRLPVRVELDIATDVVSHRFGREREAALYFVALEAIVNAQKHARATLIRVTLQRRGIDLRLEVIDDGRGMAPSDGNTRGLGLSNMRDRVSVFGGSIEIESHPGQGTRVVASIPDETPLTAPEATREGRSALPTPVD